MFSGKVRMTCLMSLLFQEEPFTSFFPDALFNMARFLCYEMEGENVSGVSKVLVSASLFAQLSTNSISDRFCTPSPNKPATSEPTNWPEQFTTFCMITIFRSDSKRPSRWGMSLSGPSHLTIPRYLNSSLPIEFNGCDHNSI